MSIAQRVQEIQNAKAAVKTAIQGKSVSVPSSAKLASYASYINQIQTGSTGLNTSDATAYAANLMSGYTAYARGSKITGSMPNYTGSTTVTPGTSAQQLSTAGKYMASNITINAASGGGTQGFQMANGTATMQGGVTGSIDVGFVPRLVGMVITRRNTTNKFVVVYDASTGIVWQSNDSAGYHKLTTASVSGTTVTFNFRLKSGGDMNVTGATPWVAAGYSA